MVVEAAIGGKDVHEPVGRLGLSGFAGSRGASVSSAGGNSKGSSLGERAHCQCAHDGEQRSARPELPYGKQHQAWVTREPDTVPSWRCMHDRSLSWRCRPTHLRKGESDVFHGGNLARDLRCKHMAGSARDAGASLSSHKRKEAHPCSICSRRHPKHGLASDFAHRATGAMTRTVGPPREPSRLRAARREAPCSR
jgi:hypothetical protein